MGMPAAGSVTTVGASNIQAFQFDIEGFCTAGEATTIDERGFCWIQGASGTPTIADSTVFDSVGASGSFSNTITGLNEQTSYRVRAYVIYGAGTSYGDTITVTTNADEPPDEAPVLALVDPDPHAVALEWNSVPRATQYELRRNGATIQTQSGLSFSEAPPPGSYDYDVRGINGAGAGPFSNIISVTIYDLALAPTLLTPEDEATVLGDLFTWEFNPGNTGATQAEFAFRRTTMDGEQWWNGTEWVNEEVFIVSTDEQFAPPPIAWES